VGLAEPVRAEIHAVVAAGNPSLARWPKMMEPLCLAELEARLTRGELLTPFTPVAAGPSDEYWRTDTAATALRVVSAG
jgi:hypothetical protein